MPDSTNGPYGEYELPRHPPPPGPVPPWSMTPEEVTAVINDMTGTSTRDLREQLIEAIRNAPGRGLTVTSAADAVLPVVEAALAEQRRRLRAVPDEHRCESVHPERDLRCTRASGHVAHVNGGDGWSCACDVNTQRAEHAEASAAAATHLLEHWADGHVILRAVDGGQVHAGWCYRCRIERAEAAVQRSREALAAFDGRGVSTPEATDWSIPTPGEVLVAWRASLDQPEGT